MPPVMGAAAFVMAEFLGVPYLSVCKAAIIPAILYYFAIFAVVHFYALKIGIQGLPKEEIPSVQRDLPQAVDVHRSTAAAHLCHGRRLLSACSRSLLARCDPGDELAHERKQDDAFQDPGRPCGDRRRIRHGICSVRHCGDRHRGGAAHRNGHQDHHPCGQPVGRLDGVCAAGDHDGVSSLRDGAPHGGLLRPSRLHGRSFLVKLGATPMAAHMFIYYFGMLCMVTPPVAFASYAGAAIAKADPMKTGWTA